MSAPLRPRQRLPLRFNELALLLAIIVVVIITAAIDSNHSYLNQPLTSFRDIARNVALLGIFALGAAVVIIAGGIDLSAGSMIAFSGTVCATTMMLLLMDFTGADTTSVEMPTRFVVCLFACRAVSND